MIQRYVPSKLVDYLWDDKTEDARLAFGEECEPGEAAEYEHRPQPLDLVIHPQWTYEEVRDSYFDSLRFWMRAEGRCR